MSATDCLLQRYEELFNRIDKSDAWLSNSKYDTWEDVKKEEFKTYQLRKNLLLQIEVIQKSLHNRLGLRYGGY